MTELIRDENGLALTDGKLKLRADFKESLPRLKNGAVQSELLVKAARMKGLTHPCVLDATAGLGQDSILLAAAGFTVELYEYDPVIAALLQDALERAAAVPELKESVSRMHFHREDSILAMQRMRAARMYQNPPAIDVVLLDPMFPERRKSALVKKKFQLLQQLEHPCANEEDLLNAALGLAARKIVIKRPVKGPYLAGMKPDYSLTGKAIRYDVILSSGHNAWEQSPSG